MKRLLHKSIVLSHRQCPKRAWLESNGGVEARFGLTSLAMQEQGETVHAAARAAYPGADIIPSRMHLAAAAAQTEAVLAGGAEAVLEATFVSARMGARVDILERTSDGFEMTEVKSGGEVKEEYLEDVALQYACLTAAGVRVHRFFIQHPDTKRVLNDVTRPFDVFSREDVTETVRVRATAVMDWVGACEETLAGPMPEAKPGEHCSTPHECPFAHHCGKVPEAAETDLISFLPSKAGAVKAGIAGGMTRIGELPEAAFVNARNALVRDALQANGRVIRASAREVVRNLPFPRFFVDFESASFAIPRFRGMRPYQPVTFQFSVHSVAERGSQIEHSEFLDDSGDDPRRRFVERLLACTGNEGPVLVYSAYERTRLAELATLFPDLRGAILALISRLVDLLPIARKGYYHPAQKGSWSIKKIQTTLAPEAGSVSYGQLDGVADGMAAQAAYMTLLNPMVEESVKAARRAELLAYCRTDTKELLRFCDVLEAQMDG